MKRYRGFLLSYIKYGDQDAVAHIYCKEVGYQSFFIRGLYRKKNKKKVFLQPLAELEFNCREFSNGLTTITTLQFAEKPNEWSLQSGAMVFFIAELLNQVLRTESSEEIYQNIKELTAQLQLENRSAHVQYLTLLTQSFGINPLLDAPPYLNPLKGTFEEIETHHLFSRDISELWKAIFHHHYATPLNREMRRKMLESLMVYYQIHFPDFKIPASLEVLQQVMA